MLIRISFIVVIVACLGSCKLFHKSTAWQEEVNVDSIAIWPDNYEYSETWTGNEEILYSKYQGSKDKVWDLVHTDISLEFDFEKRYPFGSALLTLTPHIDAQDSIIIDAKGMRFNGIYEQRYLVKNKPASISYRYLDSQHLILKLNRSYKKGDTLQVSINYSAHPYDFKSTDGGAISGDRGMYFINHDLKNPFKPRQIWTQGETESSSRWFPTLDAPNQKTTLRIAIIVPDTMVTLSNGEMVKSEPAGQPGKRKDVWEQKLPHAPYLTMLAVGNWATVKDQWRGKEVNYLLEKQYEPYARMIFGNTPAMMEFFSNYLGVDFPWTKYSQVVVRDFVSGAMENTTATVHMEQLQHSPAEHRDETYEDYISHELFHQWFGDLVTTESWSNITLNESFATYGEYLWREYHYNKENAEGILNDFRDQYRMYGLYEGKHLVRYDYEDENELFDNISYQKGACILHMLRYTVGEVAFREGLKLYLTQKRFKSAEVADLRLAFEEVTGRDLQWFFNQWYFDTQHPQIRLSTEKNATGNWTLKVAQFQEHRNTYAFPFKVKFEVRGAIYEKSFFAGQRIQNFDLGTTEKPDWFIFDSDNILLCDEELESVDFTGISDHLAQINKAWQHASFGNQIRLFDLAKIPSDFLEGNEQIDAIKPMLKNIYTKALATQNNPLIRNAIEYAGGNTEYGLIIPSADGEAIDASLFKVARNPTLQPETRKTALANLYYSGMNGKTLMQFTQDSSLAVASFAIGYIYDPGVWKEYATNMGVQLNNGDLATTWARKLIVNNEGNPSQILKDLAENKAVKPEQFYKAVSALFYYTSLEIQTNTAINLAETLSTNNKTMLKALLFRIAEEVQEINSELAEMDDYDPQLEQELNAKKKALTDVMSRYSFIEN